MPRVDGVAMTFQVQSSELPAVVVLDGYGVMWRTHDGRAGALLDFVREQGSDLSENEIVTAYRAATCGKMTSREFWARVGLDGPGLDRRYTARYSAAAGLSEFLAVADERGVRVGCLSNDVAEWSALHRQQFALERVAPWVVSAQLGLRKPDEGAYQAVLDLLDVAADRVVYVDDRAENLDAAEHVGMRTVMFGGAPTQAHRAVGGFVELSSVLRGC